MKYIVSLGLMMAAFSVCHPRVSAQVMEARFGHIDTQSLSGSDARAQLPSRQRLKLQLQVSSSRRSCACRESWSPRVGEYQQKAETWPAAIRAQKEQEITGDQQGLGAVLRDGAAGAGIHGGQPVWSP